jgi:hypothetical protein
MSYNYSFTNINFSKILPEFTMKLVTEQLDDTNTEGLKDVYFPKKHCGTSHCISNSSGCELSKCNGLIGDCPGPEKNYLYNFYKFGCTGPNYPTKPCPTSNDFDIYGYRYAVCGSINGKRTCSLDNTVGNCISEDCKKDVDWHLTYSSAKDPSKIPKTKMRDGWMNCKYSYDFSDFEYLKEPTQATDLKNFLTTLLTGKNVHSMNGQGLPPSLTYWFSYTTFSYLINIYWFQKLYEEKTNIHFDFTSKDGTELTLQKNDILNLMRNSFSSILNLLGNKDLDFPVDFKTCMISKMFLPTISSSGTKNLRSDLRDFDYYNFDQINLKESVDTLYVTIPISSMQYEVYKNAKDIDKPSLLTTWFSYLLNDAAGSFVGGTNKLKNIIPGLTPLSLDPISVNVFTITITGGSEYQLSKASPPKITFKCVDPVSFTDFSKPEYSGYFATSFNIKCKITKWTPMLMVYVLIDKGFTISSKLSQQMTEDTEFLPMVTYNKSCSNVATMDKDICTDYIIDHCSQQKYSPPPNYYIQTIQDTLFIGDLIGGANICQCYNSLLQPIISRYDGNITAMCFDKHCKDDTIQTLFNLNDTVCGSKCQQMYSWINDTSSIDFIPANAVAYNRDTAKWDKLCGNYKPKADFQTNKYVGAYSGCIGASVILVLVFSLIASKFSVKTILGVSIPSAIAISVGIILVTLELRGTSSCEKIKGQLNDWPKEFKCRSRWLKKEISTDFCKTKYSCYCSENKTCGEDCSCISSQCIPNSYEKTGAVVKLQSVKINYIEGGLPVVNIIVLTIAFFIFLKVKTSTETKLLISFIYFILIGLMVFTIHFGIVKTMSTKLVNACKA